MKCKYNQTYYTNIILFDVCHDPNTLFNKLNPNLLVKLIFKNIEYTPSKYMYKEVLYKFLCLRDHLFFPKEADLEKLLYYIDNYQISVESFSLYFKKLIEDFFLFNNWENLNYILFDRRLLQDYNELFKLVHKSSFYKISTSQKERNLCYFMFYQIIGSIFDPDVISEDDRINVSKLLVNEYYRLHQEKDSLRNLTQCLENVISNKIKLDLIQKESCKGLSSLIENENNDNPNLINDLISKYSGFTTHLNKKQFSKEEFLFRFLALNQTNEHRNSKTKIKAFTDYLICNKKYKNMEEEGGDNRDYIEDGSLFIQYIFIPEFEKFTQWIEDKTNLKNEIIEYINRLKQYLSNDRNIFIDSNTNIDNNKVNKLKNLTTNSKNENTIKIDFKMSDKKNTDIFVKFEEFLADVFKRKKLFSFVSSMQSLHISKEKEKNKSYILVESDKFNIEKFNVYENLTNPAFDYLVIKDLNKIGYSFYTKENEVSNQLSNENDNEDNDEKIDTKRKKVDINKNKMEVELNESDEEHFTDNDDESEVYIKKSVNILDSLNSGRIYRTYLEIFAELGVEFRLKNFFSEFVKRLKISLSSTKAIDFSMLAFNKLSHEFYRLGLFHRKYMKNSDLFVKNYYDFYNFFK